MLGLENKMLSMVNKQGRDVILSTTKALSTLCMSSPYLIGTVSYSTEMLSLIPSCTDQGSDEFPGANINS